MQIIRNPLEWQQQTSTHRQAGRSIGFVPTMGALHEGHLSLIHQSKQENDITCTSIFVNPAQFDNPEDLENYPVTWDDDIAALETVGVDMLLYPAQGSLYPDNYTYKKHHERFQ